MAFSFILIEIYFREGYVWIPTDVPAAIKGQPFLNLIEKTQIDQNHVSFTFEAGGKLNEELIL